MANRLGREQGIVLCREGQVCLLSNVRKIALPLEQCSDKLTAHHKRQAHEAWGSSQESHPLPREGSTWHLSRGPVGTRPGGPSTDAGTLGTAVAESNRILCL